MMTKFFSDCVMVHVLSNKTNIVVNIDKKKTYREGQYKYKESKYNILTKMIFFWAVNVLQKLA